MTDEIDPDMNTVLSANSLKLLERLPENHFHAIVTDPPYNYEGGFMGEDWDNVGTEKEYQEWCRRWSEAALHTLKPGGHLIAFSGNRTHHRLFSGVEDAGYEIRDTLVYLYGTGFPKGARLSTYLDDPEELEKWGDWRGMLKPAFEPALLARAPFSGSAVGNQRDHGTGALNIENGRILTTDNLERPQGYDITGDNYNRTNEPSDVVTEDSEGRYPANVMLDPEAAALLDAQSGEAGDLVGTGEQPDPENKGLYGAGRTAGSTAYTDSGGASRFFYTSEPAGEDDEQAKGRYPANVMLDPEAAALLDAQSGKVGCGKDTQGESAGTSMDETNNLYAEGFERSEVAYNDEGGASRFFYTSKASKDERTHGGRVENDHPTVKPIDLMEWLIGLVTAEGQNVLDPFTGSGSTLLACRNTNRNYLGLEVSSEWASLARERLRVDAEETADEAEAE